MRRFLRTHSRRAGKGRFFAQRRGGRAQRKAGHAPYRFQCGGPYPPLIHQLVEGLQMALFLRRHMFDGFHAGGGILAAFQDGKLALIDAHCAILTGMRVSSTICGMW